MSGPAPPPERARVGERVPTAREHADALFRSLGAPMLPLTASVGLDDAPSLVWAASGVMTLTGEPAGPPRLAPAPLASCARGALEALRALARICDGLDPGGLPADGAALLGERAALSGLRRRGTTAPGGTCRLIRAADGWLALNLARDDDVASLPAWLEQPLALGEGDPFDAVAQRIRARSLEPLVARARMLALAAAPAAPPPVADADTAWCRVDPVGTRAPCPGRSRTRGRRPPLVVDLSALWAGPLCAELLGLAGAKVVKVESTRRPDGARRGALPFFDLLNASKRSVALDFRSEAGLAALRRLLESADLVIESSRPRALAQLGIDANELVRRVPGLSWVSITGYGRAEPWGGWVAFGDDAAVAAGLATATGDRERPLFCGDAIADPLTGLHAAVAALASWRAGGGRLVELALRDVVAHALALGDDRPDALVEPDAQDAAAWAVRSRSRAARVRVAEPRARRPVARARELGADTRDTLRELGRGC